MAKRILMVEDEENLVYAVSLRLKAAGFEVIAAYDGQEGLDKARAEKPDLILLDIMLPKLDGYKVCRMLKFDDKYKAIPIIMLTVKGEHEDKQLGFEVGVDAYITKPFDPDILLAKINELLNK